jgi:L-fucono-1,5-lactonase
VIVDAHHHLWDTAARWHAWLDPLPGLRRPYLLPDYQEVAAPEGVTAAILIQVLASTAETEEFLAVAAGSAATGPPVIAGVVGWADLTRADISDELDRLRGLPGGDRLVGLRHLVEGEPDPGWLTRPGVRRGLRAAGAAGLTFDLLVRPAQLPAALRTVTELSDVRFVLDHGAKPEIADGRREPWAALVGELAARPNVTCKLSGLVTEAAAGWTAADVQPYVDRLLDTFGPGRLMFGSDWPVCTLAASYREVLDLARAALSPRLGPGELDAVFGANAVTAYRLPLTLP